MNTECFIEDFLKQKNSTYHREYEVVKFWCEKMWSEGQVCNSIMDHGPDHSRKVLAYMNTILEKALNAQEHYLSDIELYLLCLSAWLHDIGMQVKFEDGGFRPYSSPLSLKQQIDIRKNHAILTEKIIQKMTNNIDITGDNIVVSNRTFNPALQLLCGMHRVNDINTIGRRLHKLPFDVRDNIRLKPLIGLLQFCDAAHMSKDRVVGKDVERLYLSGEISGYPRYFLEQQYFNCLYIDDIRVQVGENGTISGTLICSRSDKDDEGIIEKQMDIYWGRIQKRHNDSIYLIKELDQNWKFAPDIRWNLPRSEKQPRPRNLNIGKGVPTHPVFILGLIGVGQASTPQLLAAKELPGLEFRYFAEKNSENKDILNQIGYNSDGFYEEYTRLLETKEIDAVVVATESRNHYYHAKAVLNAGKHLLLEKPATQDLSQLNDLIRISKEKNLCFVCSLHAAFDQTINWILDKENIAYLQKRYGWTNNITRIKCEFYDPYLYDQTPIRNRFSSLDDSWVDSGINALSVVDRFVDCHRISHRQCHFEVSSSPYYRGTIIYAKVEYSFNENGEIFIHTSWRENINRKRTILTDNEGMEITLDHSQKRINLKAKAKTIEIQSFDKDRLVQQYVDLYRDFCMHLLNETNNSKKALKLHELLFKATENAQPEI